LFARPFRLVSHDRQLRGCLVQPNPHGIQVERASISAPIHGRPSDPETLRCLRSAVLTQAFPPSQSVNDGQWVLASRPTAGGRPTRYNERRAGVGLLIGPSRERVTTISGSVERSETSRGDSRGNFGHPGSSR